MPVCPKCGVDRHPLNLVVKNARVIGCWLDVEVEQIELPWWTKFWNWLWGRP